MRTLIIPVLAGTIALSGCSTNPYSGDTQVSKTGWGAGIGAVAGAAAGAATGGNAKERRERALKGAAIGGVAGAGVGAYMDYQDRKLRERLQGVGVGVHKDKDTGVITLVMPGNITFPSAGSSIKADFYPVLDAVADVFKEYDKTSIEISGHTDNVGRDDYNQKLSQDRADAVSQYMVSRGISAARLTATGFGKSRPAGSNNTEEGRAQNRRVEIRILPPASV